MQLKRIRLIFQFFGQIGLSKGMSHRRSFALCRVHVALHFAKRYRTLCESAVAVEHRVDRVLPSLMNEHISRPPLVFHEAVAIPPDVFLHTLTRRLYIPPDLYKERNSST